MATSGVKSYGVTAPLSTALPTEAELQASTALVEELKRQNNYESPAEEKKRQKVIQSLQSIAEEFVRKVLRLQGVSENVVKSAGGRIETFGSFKLGVVGPGSDIDALLIGPKQVKHADFFEHFPELLYKMAPDGAITDFTPKPDAFAPCITFKFSGIDIDLLYARIASHSQITKDLSMLDRELLRGLAETEVRSLNGVRVADELLSLVPQQSVFRTALRVIKLWGTRRAISGNMYGFPGGVAFAILVARICQLYPMATSSTIVLKFFKILEKWQWPMPVMLKPIETDALGFKVWNPKIYPSDKNHIMPIITPAYPSMCTTHNFSLSTQAVIQKELRRGGDVADKILTGKAQWKDLFTKHTFFTAGYKYYLTVVSASTTEESQLLWSGFVESKVRLLVSRCDEHPSIALAHPFNKGYSRVHRCRTTEEIEAVKKGSLKYHAKDIATATTGHGLAIQGAAAGEAVNGESSSKDNEQITMVYTTTNYIGLELREGAKSLDLSWQVDSFKSLCTQWSEFHEDLNALNIVHIRNFELPDDVFVDGETKPVRPKSKKSSHGKRRTSSEDNEQTAKRQHTSVAAAG